MVLLKDQQNALEVSKVQALVVSENAGQSSKICDVLDDCCSNVSHFTAADVKGGATFNRTTVFLLGNTIHKNASYQSFNQTISMQAQSALQAFEKQQQGNYKGFRDHLKTKELTTEQKKIKDN